MHPPRHGVEKSGSSAMAERHLTFPFEANRFTLYDRMPHLTMEAGTRRNRVTQEQRVSTCAAVMGLMDRRSIQGGTNEPYQPEATGRYESDPSLLGTCGLCAGKRRSTD